MLGIGLIIAVIIGAYLIVAYTRLFSMRDGLSDYHSPVEKLTRYVEMEKYLHSINVQADYYPEFKASDPYIKLQQRINILEGNLSASRRIYNENVTSYNAIISTFPNLLFAGAVGVKLEILLKIEGAKRADVNWTVS